MSISSRDQKYVWHPYTQHGLSSSFLPVKKAKGAYLYLEDGNTVFDAISSWWVNLLGHGHPSLIKAISKQAKKLDHVIFAGFTHAPATKLARELISLCHERNAFFSKVFFSDNGSTAVEVALKMAYQYQAQKGRPERKKFLALKNSYHGDTIGAMSVGESELFPEVFRNLTFAADFIEPNDLDSAKKLFQENKNQYAALIVEPLVQGAGGMRMYSADFLNSLCALAKQENIIVIFDEVFTGFYRTGSLFAFEKISLRPDLICLSKGITGGVLPLAVTLATDEIFEGFLSEDLKQAFLHGHSYTANPIDCAAALATLKELERKKTKNKIKKIEKTTRKVVSRFEKHPRIRSATSLGTIGRLELKTKNPGYYSEVSKIIKPLSVESGVLIRPLGNVIYTVPPYCTTAAELEWVYDTIEETLDRKEIKQLLAH